MDNVVYLRTPIHMPLRPADLQQFLSLVSEKHSKLTAAMAARRAGDKDRANLLWLQCKAINRRIKVIESRRPRA